jgi:hypothetical protein
VKPYGPAIIDRIAELWASKLTTREIGAELGIPKNSVCRLAFNARARGDERFPPRGSSFHPLREESKVPKPPKHRVFPASLRPTRPIGPRRIYELIERECRYPVDIDAVSSHHLFCAAATLAETSYCEKHLALCNASAKPLAARYFARL